MYARLGIGAVPKENLNEALKIVKESTWPTCKKLKGYKGYLYLTDPQTGEAVVVSLWNTEDDALASQKALYTPEGLKKYVGLGYKNISTKHYVVEIKD